MLRGPCLHGPMSVAFFALSRVLPLYHCPIAFTGWGTIALFGMGLGAMGSTDFTKLLFLLPIAQRIEARGQTQKDSGSNPGKMQHSTLRMENRSDLPYGDQPTTTIVANHSWSTYCELYNLRNSSGLPLFASKVQYKPSTAFNMKIK